MILGTACGASSKPMRLNPIIEKAPMAMPDLYDKSPQKCPECTPVNDQEMLKMTVRDFLRIKTKIRELDDYRNYLMDILHPFVAESK